MNSYDFDKYFPMQGTCYHCGRDLRHHTLETICRRFSEGESIGKIANEFKVPPQAIEIAISQNTMSPTGRTISPMVRRAAA
ncbi:MAG TPA: hypothetical protein PKY59_10045 [Pyrinomonadaceae bacterium]|nr:hypothetical protein [Pyrinomonadaceae bacterium]